MLIAEPCARRAEDKIIEIDQKIAALEGMKKALKQLAATCSGRGALTKCPILECLGSEKEMLCDARC